MLLALAIFLLVVYVVLGFKKPGVAIITSPVVSIVLALIARAQYRFEVVIIAPVIFLATLIAVLVSRHKRDTEKWPKVWAKGILVSIALLLLLAVGFVLFGNAGSIGLGFLILFIGLLVSYGLTSKYAIAAYVISTIGSSIRQNLPLAMALETAAGEQTDERSRILRRIQKWLVQGYPLSESIKRGYPKCPGYAVAMIAAAERIDQLPAAFGGIEADIAVRADERRKVRPIHPFYPVVLVIFMSFMVLGLATFVMPKFEGVLTELSEGEYLPTPTRFLLGVTRFFTWEAGSLLLTVFAIIVFVVVPIWLRTKFRPRRPQKPYLTSRIGDFIKWHLPVLHWFEKNYSMVQVVELLRLSLNAGCTVNEAISNTLGLDVNSRFRRRLQKWLAKVEAGNNIADSARESKLSNSLAWAFDDKVNQGNTLAILETLESFYRSNYSYAANMARFIMGPCIVIIMGIIVGFIVYAIFSPMVAVLNHLAGLVTP